MKFWQTTCLLLCCYGYFKELRPSEPFLTDYLTGPVHNLTQEQVLYEVYPVWTYSYMALLVLVFLFTDFLRYKPVIVFEAIAYIATYSLLLFARGVPWMQFMEFCYGIVSATEVAYYTYMYAQVSGEHYQKVASFTRVAILLGRFSAAVLGQVLYSTGVMDAHSLNYISMGSFVFALGFAVALPKVKHSVYFHRDENILRAASASSSSKNERDGLEHTEVLPEGLVDGTKNEVAGGYTNDPETIAEEGRSSPTSKTPCIKEASFNIHIEKGIDEEEQSKFSLRKSGTPLKKSVQTSERIDNGSETSNDDIILEPPKAVPSQYSLEGFKTAMGFLWRDTKFAYNNEHLVRWSCWSAAATCGFLQILNYIQSLYEKVLPEGESLYSGAVDALCTAGGALAALSVAYISVDFGRKGEWVLGMVAFLQAGLLTLMGVTSSIWVVYACFALYRTSHEFLITVASYQVARVLRSDTYGLVFGLNMFCALLMQTVLTVVVVDVLQIEIGLQFVIYGVYYACLSLLFLTLASYSLGRHGCSPPPAPSTAPEGAPVML